MIKSIGKKLLTIVKFLYKRKLSLRVRRAMMAEEEYQQFCDQKVWSQQAWHDYYNNPPF
jgi:hypothetical protein